MDERLERQLNQILGDNSAERQILLLKLVNEFENAPSFREKYIASATSPEQLWISRIGALLSRCGLEHKVAFRATKTTSVQFWQLARDFFMRNLSEAIEEIKLELELEGREEIGQVYDSGKEFDFFSDLKSILAKADTEVFVVDAYFDGPSFDAYIPSVGNSVGTKILCSRYSADVTAHINKYVSQNKAIIELRKSKDIHDRVIFVDQSDCWIVGASIKDAGKKPTYLIPLMPQIVPEKLKIYNQIWEDSKLVSE